MLQLKGISKSFGAFVALRGVSVEIQAGEIHGLVGVNGSGKSTLLNIISGQRIIHDTGGFSGEMRLENRERRFLSPSQAFDAGVGMVHQEFALIPGLSVSENITLTGERTFPLSRKLLGRDLARIDPAANRSRASRILGRMGVKLDPDLDADLLPVSMKQFVEMARECNRDRLKLLLLDEPTSVLGRDEAGRLMDAVKSVAEKGAAVLYVSHRLEEILAFCHRTTVLRNGEIAGSLNRRQSGVRALSGLMVGEDIRKTRRTPASAAGDPVIQTTRFSVDKPGDPLKGLDLDIHQGEILGVTSLSGHGRTALGPGIMGLYQATGRLRIFGESVHAREPIDMIRRAVWMLSDERGAEGVLPDHSIVENMTFAAFQTKGSFSRKRLLPFLRFPHGRRRRAFAEKWIRALDIHCRSPFQKTGELSGGNQQKVCIASALSMAPRILLVNDPTRGLDIAAKEAILALLVEAHDEHGMTVVISSGELEELKRISDRIAVLYMGGLFDVMTPDRSDDDFVLACSGMEPEEL